MKKISSSGIFKDFYCENYIYVDKTEDIYDLISNNKKVFISRPRRFGKSLLLDTIGVLFEKGVEPYFKDTWIYDKWNGSICPVLRIDFLQFPKDDLSEFKRQFNLTVSEFAKRNNVTEYTEDKEPNVSLKNLLTCYEYKDQQIVLLFDEYDCQLSANINNTELYEKYRTLIQRIYAVLKGSRAIKFMAVTGVTRLKDASIFSVGSDIKDISNYSPYAQIIGFTRDEIKHFYIDYLKLAASYDNHCTVDDVTDKMVEKVLDRMATEYDGYCFDEKGKKKVFSTWSVNNFLQQMAADKECYYGDYWYDNGGLPSILVNYYNSHKLTSLDYLCSNESITVDYDVFMNPSTLQSMDEHVLMCQTGYLTLKAPVSIYDDISLGVPNEEIRRAMLIGLARYCFTRRPKLTKEEWEILKNGDVKDIVSLFDSIMNTIVYDNYEVDCEGAVRNSLYLYLSGARVVVKAESHSSKGRADLIIETDNRRIVVELKHTDSEDKVQDLLNEAVCQIKERDYGNIVPVKNELLRIGAVFNSEPKVRAFSFLKVDLQ